jgi:glucose/arabinose dehydrogenase
MRPGSLVPILVLCSAALLGGGCSSGKSGAKPAGPEESNGFRTGVVVSGLTAPTAFAFLPGGRILVAEQAGVIRLVKNGKLAKQPFLDIRHEVNTYTQRGLLGLAIDPDYGSNGYVYLFYTYEDNPGRPRATKTARLTRVTVHGDIASPSSEVVLLGTLVGTPCRRLPVGSDCIPNDWMGHSVGDIAFARDGTLFLGTGDAANWFKVTPDALRAQNLDSLAGKILHVTRQGKGVPTNPFWTGDPDAVRSKVWAYGLRNPFRFALSPLNGLPYVGDVGWSAYEEIDVAAAGSDLGWPCYEGPKRQPAFGRLAACRSLYKRGSSAVTQPLVTWRQTAVRAASIGGSFNTGSALPPVFAGAYFYGDYVRSEIDYVQVDRNNRIVSGPWPFVQNANGLVDIRFGPEGDLYYLSVTGELRRMHYESAPAGPPLVGRPAAFPAGANPHSVVAADVNDDGTLDLVAADAGSSDAAVLLGRGDGDFAPAMRYATGLRPKVVIAVDVNGDGSTDLVSANQDVSSVSVLLGNDDGTFGEHRDYPTCADAHDVTSGDLDGDGRVDLAVACWGGTVVSVLPGNGDGTFGQHVDYESGNAPHSIVAHDLNGDGRLDLAVANHDSDSVGVLLGAGGASFAPVVTYEVGSQPHRIAAGDLNGDGHPDLVTANDGSADVSVLLGRGDGTFAKAASYEAGMVPKGVAVADVDGDGHLDVVTANTGGNYGSTTRNPFGDTVSVLLGTGTGELGSPVTYLAGQTPFSVAVADLNGDGRQDIATANWDGGTVSVLPGLGAGP